MLLAVLGLYGLVSYAVSQRAPEIGLRMAIGATQLEVQRMILRQAAILAITGAATGLGVAIAGRPLVANAAQVPVDPGLVALTVGVLILIVLAAAWFPARRAARIEPSLALKGR